MDTKISPATKAATDAILLSCAFDIQNEENPIREPIETVIQQVIDSETSRLTEEVETLRKELADALAAFRELVLAYESDDLGDIKRLDAAVRKAHEVTGIPLEDK